MARTLKATLLSLLAAGLLGGGTALGEDGPPDAGTPTGHWELFLAKKPLLQDLGAGIPKKHRCEHWIFPGGLWAAAFAEANGSATVITGWWSAKGESLGIRTGDGKAIRPVIWLPMALVDEQLMVPAEPEPLLDPSWAWITGEEVRWSLPSKTSLQLRGPAAHPYLQFTRRDEVRAQDLTGTWTGEGSTFTFREDGRLERTEDLSGHVARLTGTWKLARGMVRVELEGALAQTFAPFLADGLHLLADHDQDGVIEHLRLAKGEEGRPGGEAPAPTKPAPTGVVGVWVAPMEGGQAKITFREGGTYTREWPEGGKTRRFGGTYEVKGTDLLVEDAEEPGTVLKVPFRRVGDDGLELTIEGETLRLSREGATALPEGPSAGPVPAALHGTWLAKDETGSMRLDLTADGRFVLALESPGKKWRYAGPCGAREGVLEGRDEASGSVVRLPYRSADADTLVVTVSEVEFQLKRQGATPRPAPAEAALPPEALGTWGGQLFTRQGFDAGSVTLTLRSDKTYALTWRLPGHIIPRTGTYKVEGNVLTMMAKGEGPISVEFRLGENGLTLDAFAAMQPTTLTRQP